MFQSINISGKISAFAPGQTQSVTIVVNTNGASSNLGVTAAPDGSFATAYTPTKAGVYTAVATVAEDSLYLAAVSPIATFNVVDVPTGKLPRTITLNVG